MLMSYPVVCAAVLLWHRWVPLADGVPMTICVATTYQFDVPLCGRPAYYQRCGAELRGAGWSGWSGAA